MTDLILADVSRHQGTVDWAAYGARTPAAICKATGGSEGSGGTSWVDPMFEANQRAMRTHLRVRGFYHFLQLGVEDPVAQARHFAKTVGSLLPGEFAVLDVEQDAHVDRHEAFCAEVDRLLGGRCWLYGGRAVPNPNRRPFWVARYYNDKPDPSGEPDVEHVLWQFTSKGRIAGVDGDVDLNVHRGGIASLLRYTLTKEGDPTMADLSAQEVSEAVLRVLNKYGTGKGQTTWASTVDATLAGIQGLTNLVRPLAGVPALLREVHDVVVAIRDHLTAPLPVAAEAAGGVDVEQLADLVVERLAQRLRD